MQEAVVGPHEGRAADAQLARQVHKGAVGVGGRRVGHQQCGDGGQAEHDPAAQSILITDDAAFAARVEAAVSAQLRMLATR